MVFSEYSVTKEFDNFDAQKLVACAMRFDSEIILELGTKKINAKSLMGVISMTLRPGNVVTVIAKGDDQEEAMASVGKSL